MQKKSAASLRADHYPKDGGEWHCGFAYTELPGLGYEEGVHRRDPSSVIMVEDKYYVWYTKSIGPHFGQFSKRDPGAKIYPWDYADLWYATSTDGIHWQEQGCAVARGGKGAYDERTVCTPDILAHEGRYYLVYQTLPQGNYTGGNENVAMAVADKPEGPWVKTGANVLEPMAKGIWFDSKDNYNEGEFLGLNHDPCLFYYRDKFYLYFKCASKPDGLIRHSGNEDRWGVAIADQVTGPYIHSDYNPITNSGHETLLWQYKEGMAALLNRDGPEKDTIQYAEDGINFEIMAKVSDTPQAGGPFRCSNWDDSPLEGIRWGLCHYDERGSLWNYIVRFDLDMRHPYSLPHVYADNNSRELRN